jgi:hypothetical protein
LRDSYPAEIHPLLGVIRLLLSKSKPEVLGLHELELSLKTLKYYLDLGKIGFVGFFRVYQFSLKLLI